MADTRLYHAFRSVQSADYFKQAEYITETEIAGDDAPNGMERRLVLRLLSHWRELVGERQYPSFSKLDPESIPDIWSYSVVLDIAGHADDPIFRVAGPKYAGYSPVDLRNLPISEAPRDSLIEKSVAFAQEVIAKQVPFPVAASL